MIRVAGYGLQVAGYWLQVTGYGLLITDHRSLMTVYYLGVFAPLRENFLFKRI